MVTKIAISGKANSGKNTLAMMLDAAFSQHNRRVEIYAFANRIKEIIQMMIPRGHEQTVHEHLYGKSYLRKEKIPGLDDITYRKACLEIGKVGRSFNDNLWINHFLDHFSVYGKDVYIITDLRFINEFNKLKSLDFITIRIKRRESIVIDDISDTQQDSIPDSEFNYIIDNDYDLDHLTLKCQEIYNQIKYK